ncbi:MAG: YSC84-related protein, partial [candidate division NC10 bacterium]
GAGAKLKTADIYAYSRAQGIFAGISLDGSVISTRDKWNSAYYDTPGVQPLDILVLRNVSNKKAEPLVETLDKATKQ